MQYNKYIQFSLNPFFLIYRSDDANETELLFDELFDDDDIETKNKYLYAAAEQCKPEVAKKLIEKGADVNSTTGADKWRPIHGATYNDCLEVAKILIENKADVNAKIRIGYSSLHIAAHNGNFHNTRNNMC